MLSRTIILCMYTVNTLKCISNTISEILKSGGGAGQAVKSLFGSSCGTEEKNMVCLRKVKASALASSERAGQTMQTIINHGPFLCVLETLVQIASSSVVWSGQGKRTGAIWGRERVCQDAIPFFATDIIPFSDQTYGNNISGVGHRKPTGDQKPY